MNTPTAPRRARPNLPRTGLVLLVVCVAVALALAVIWPPRGNGVSGNSATAALASGATTSPPVCAADSAGAVFDFPAEGFRAWFPCPPRKVIRHANAVPFGDIEIISYEAEAGGVSYAAAYVNYSEKLPAAAFDLARSIVLDGAKRSLVRGQPVQNPVFTATQAGTLSGALVAAQGPDKKLRGGVWLAKQVTYQLLALAPNSLSDETAIDRFMNSFQALSDTVPTNEGTPGR